MKNNNQRAMIHKYNDEHRERFNEDLFYRNDNDIITELQKVILSFQRNKYFTIKVEYFEVITDYDKIIEELKENEATRVKNSKDNKFNYISIKDSDIKLLVVHYYLRVHDGQPDNEDNSRRLKVLIEVPRIVDKYYFRIYGNMYASMFQIVDGSTYNNSSSKNAKSQCVTLKSMFMATRAYRYTDNIKLTDGTVIPCVYFVLRVFDKPNLAMKYLLAKFGLSKTLDMLRVIDLIISKKDIKDDNYYTAKKGDLYVSLPKYIYDNDQVAQSMMYTILNSINKDATFENIFTCDFWAKSLGYGFGSKTAAKGYAILDSFESILDLATKESLRLPYDQKKDIYSILVWILREFTALRKKDIYDISMKRARFPEYIAALYAIQQSKKLYGISNDGSRITISRIVKAVYTYPDVLLKEISRDKLINYNNMVNDLDAFAALKYTYKGVSGVGEENNGSSTPEAFRMLHKSHIGRLDLDSSSASDPGLSGTICPLAKLDGGYFSDYQEPNTWREETDQLLKNYRDLVGLKDTIEFKKSLGYHVDDDLGIVNESLGIFNELIHPVKVIEDGLTRGIVYI